MATGKNFINAQEIVERLTKSFREHEKAIDDNVTKLISLDKAYSKLPSEYIQAQKEILALQKQQATTERELLKVTQEGEKVRQQKARSEAAESRAKATKIRTQETELRQQKRIQKEREKEAKQLEQSASRYVRLNKILGSLRKEYRDLAISQELNGKLTAKETARLNTLIPRIEKLDKAFKKVDAGMGQHFRSVGNYAKAFDGLGFSVAQLTREAPAFANSMQTGLMAISNNIPIFVDEVQRLVQANKALQSEGKPTVNVLKRVGAAFFSWHTLLSFGVTLLTLYGPKLFDWGKKLLGVKDATKDLAEWQQKLNERTKEIREQSEKEIAKLLTLDKIIKSKTVSQKERTEAYKDLQKLYPAYLGNLAFEEKNYKLIENAIRRVREELLKKAKQNAVEEELTGLMKQRVKFEREYNDELKKQSNAYQTANNTAEDYRNRLLEINEYVKRQRVLMNEGKITQEEFNKVAAEASDKVLTLARVVNKNSDAATNASNSMVNLEKDFLKNTGAIDKQADALLRTLSGYDRLIDKQGKSTTVNKESKTVLEGSVAALEKLRSELEDQQRRLATNTDEWNSYQTKIDEVTAKIELLTKGQKALNDVFAGEGTKAGTFSGLFGDEQQAANEFAQHLRDKDKENFERAEEEKRKILEDSLAKQKELRQNFHNAIKDMAFGSIQAIFDAQISAIDAEIEERNRYYDAQLDNEKISEEQRKILETRKKQDEEKLRKERKKKEKDAFLVQQGIAVAEIAIEAAKGIAAATAQAPATFGASLSYIPLIVGTAAAQTGLVLAQTIPALWTGGETEKSGDILVNDDPLGVKGSNYKEVVKTPDGKLSFPQGKNVKMNVPKGTQVYPTYDAFFNSLDELTLQRAIFNMNMASQGQMLSQNDTDNALLTELVHLRESNSKVWHEVKKLASRPINNHVTIETPNNSDY